MLQDSKKRENLTNIVKKYKITLLLKIDIKE